MADDPRATPAAGGVRSWRARDHQQKEDAFGKSEAGGRIQQIESEHARLEQRVAQLENLLNNLQGGDGIKVSLPVISLERPEAPHIETEDIEICRDGEAATVTVVTRVDLR